MRRVPLVALWLLVLPTAAVAWSTTVTAPGPELPAVQVSVGYGDYVPEQNAPLQLSVARAAAPFDGYIGYYLAVGSKRTQDPSWIYRASIRRGASWSAADRLLQRRGAGPADRPAREIVIAWYDRDRRLVATRAAGTPPWSAPRPLRVGSRDTAAGDRLLGDPPLFIAPENLSGSPAWYRGFSAAVIPIDGWFGLPQSTREAILRSGVRVALFGLPSGPVAITPIDEAMLAVSFQGVPLRPVPRPGSHQLWDRDLRMAILPGVAWAASESDLREPLPASEATVLNRWWDDLKVVPPSLLRRSKMPLLGVLALLVSVTLWKWTRKRSSLVPMGVAVLLACGSPFYRDFIQPRSGGEIVESVTMQRSGVFQRTILERHHGPSPLVFAASDGTAAMRTFGASWLSDHPTVISREPGGTDVVGFASAWANLEWLTTRFEPGEPFAIDIRSAGDDRLDFGFRTPSSVDRVDAGWTSKGVFRRIAASIEPASEGRVSLPVQKTLPADVFEELDLTPAGAFSQGSDVVKICLSGESDGARTYYCRTHIMENAHFLPYSIRGSLHREGEVASTRFLLPPVEAPADTRVDFATTGVSFPIASGGLELSGEGGSLSLQSSGSVYVITAGDLRRIAPPRTVLTARLLRAFPASEERGWLSMRVGGTAE